MNWRGIRHANARAEADSIASSLPESPAAPVPVEVHPAAPAPASGHTVRRGSHTLPHSSADLLSWLLPATAEAIYQVLRQHEITLQNGFAIVYHDGPRDRVVPDAAALTGRRRR